MDPRLDFPQVVPLKRSYIVASSYRCGSTFLCSELWKTGVLGAPTEYVNIDPGNAVIATAFERGVLMSRLGATNAEDYFKKLLACRTSRNGIFGMKAHFHHFEPALSWYPPMLEVLSPITYVYMTRRDKQAQAVSMAKAMQTKAWTSLDVASGKALRYDRDFIAQCLNEIEKQRTGWLRWFETNNITPFVVSYEDLLDDTGAMVRMIVELLEVQNDKLETVDLPPHEKQGDATNAAWASRFERESDVAAADWTTDQKGGQVALDGWSTGSNFGKD